MYSSVHPEAPWCVPIYNNMYNGISIGNSSHQNYFSLSDQQPGQFTAAGSDVCWWTDRRCSLQVPRVFRHDPVCGQVSVIVHVSSKQGCSHCHISVKLTIQYHSCCQFMHALTILLSYCGLLACLRPARLVTLVMNMQKCFTSVKTKLNATPFPFLGHSPWNTFLHILYNDLLKF